MNSKLSFLCIALLAGGGCFAASNAIGVALSAGANGAFTVNSLPATGETSFSDGSVLTTAGVPSEVRLQNGTAIRLATHSSGTVYADHLSLEQGSARISRFDEYPVDAKELRIEADTAATQAIVRLNNNTVEIASLGGALRVTEGGALLTRVASGTKISLRQTGASPGTTGARKPGMSHETKVFLWVIVSISAAALAIGLTAAAQGKSPF